MPLKSEAQNVTEGFSRALRSLRTRAVFQTGRLIEILRFLASFKISNYIFGEAYAGQMIYSSFQMKEAFFKQSTKADICL